MPFSNKSTSFDNRNNINRRDSTSNESYYITPALLSSSYSITYLDNKLVSIPDDPYLVNDSNIKFQFNMSEKHINLRTSSGIDLCPQRDQSIGPCSSRNTLKNPNKYSKIGWKVKKVMGGLKLKYGNRCLTVGSIEESNSDIIGITYNLKLKVCTSNTPDAAGMRDVFNVYGSKPFNKDTLRNEDLLLNYGRMDVNGDSSDTDGNLDGRIDVLRRKGEMGNRERDFHGVNKLRKRRDAAAVLF